MRQVKKTWFLKYLIAVVVSVVILIIILPYANGYYVTVPWYVYTLPLWALSTVAMAPYMRRYVYYSIEKIDTGSPSHDVLFKVLLMIAGILMLIPLLSAGIVIAIFSIINDHATYREQRRAQDKESSRTAYTMPQPIINDSPAEVRAYTQHDKGTRIDKH